MDDMTSFDIVRAVTSEPTVQIRSGTESGSLGTLFGHFSKFDSWYEVNSQFEGRFMERIAPGAFKKTMRENGANMKVLYDHGQDPQIGNKVLGNVTDLREDDQGAYYEVDLFDTSYNRDLMPGLKAGAYGASFRFNVLKEKWDGNPQRSTYNPEGLPERTIKETRTMEFGPVTFPASSAASAGMRSLTDEYYEHMKARNPKKVKELLARARELRTPSQNNELLIPTYSRDPATNEPTESHSRGLTPAQRRERLYPYLLKGIE